MNSLAQTLNQYSFVILYLLGLGVVAFALYRRRVKMQWWGVWGSTVVLLIAVIFLLRTPAGVTRRFYLPTQATVSSVSDDPLTSGLPKATDQEPKLTRSFLSDQELANFPALIRSDERLYTLVEFYSDLGIG